MEDWSVYYKGITLCLGSQLFLLSFFKLFDSETRQRALGFFLLLLGLAYLRVSTFVFVQDYTLLSFFYRDAIEIFFPPLLFLHIAIVSKQKIKYHFIFPVLYVLILLILKVGFSGFRNSNYSVITVVSALLKTGYFVFYFWWGIVEFRKKLLNQLKDKVRRKFRLFYYVINGYEIGNLLILLALTSSRWISQPAYEQLSATFASLSVRTFLLFIGFLQVLFLVIYLITESQTFKSYYVGKNIQKDVTLASGADDMRANIEHVLEAEQPYKNPEFSMKDLAVLIDQPQNRLKEFFLEYEKVTFNDFINAYRIDEFKRLSRLEENNKYDVTGLSKMAGFNSKATFYRYFNKLEGMTPKEYIEQNEQN